MNQRVPSWDLDQNSAPRTFDYEVSELTWKDGQLLMHGLSSKPPSASSPAKYSSSWDKPRAGGTLESIVHQATRLPNVKSAVDELVPWFDFDQRGSSVVNPPVPASIAVTTDALVPCSQVISSTHIIEVGPVVGSALVGSCTGLTRAGINSWETNGSASESTDHVTVETFDCDLGSPENTISGKDCDDSVCRNRSLIKIVEEKGKKKVPVRKSSVSTKRSRAADVHNQSERKRRDKINQRIETLQKLVPNSSKTDKASMLDEVIEYLKQLQAQVNMMKMNMPPMMMPLAMQQQLHMSMMAPMSMGMGMGAMDMNAIGRSAGMHGGGTPMTPAFYMPPAATQNTDPLSAYLACQSQLMSIDAYSRLAALYQPFHQPPGPGSKN